MNYYSSGIFYGNQIPNIIVYQKYIKVSAATNSIYSNSKW